MNQRGIRFVAVAGIVVLLLAGAVAGQEQERESFRAIARNSGTGPAVQMQVTINIDRWSSQEEHDHLVEVIMNENNQRIADELNSMDSVGFVRFTGGRQGQGTGSWQLRYASEWEEGGVRVIRLATDRPIGVAENRRRPSRTWDSQTSLIELTVDENGEGEGVLMAGVEFGIDAKTSRLILTHLSSSPVELVNVRH